MYSFKSHITSAVAVLFGMLFWLFYAGTLTNPAFVDLAGMLAFLSLTIALVAMSILLILLESGTRFTLLLLIITAPIFFLFPFHAIYIAVFLLTALGAWFAYHHTQQELHARIKIKISHLIHIGLTLILTALAFAIASVYYVESLRGSEITLERILPKKTFVRVMHAVELPVFNALLPNFDKNITVDEYLLNRISTESGIDVRQLPRAQQLALLEEAHAQLFELTGSRLVGAEPVTDALYDIVIAYSRSFFDPISHIVPILLALGFFIFLRTIAFPYGWLITLLAWGSMKLLSVYGLIIKVEEKAIKEHVRWQP